MELTKKILKELIAIDSTQGKEKDLGDYIVNLFSKDFDIFKQKTPQSESTNSFPERHNLIITRDNPNIFFFGHLDTISAGELSNWKITSPFSPIERDEKIYGLGAVDMKGGIATSIAACLEKNPSNMGFCFTCDEEYQFLGIKTLIASDYFRKFNPSLVVFCEPTDLEIINTHRGCLEMKVEVIGKSAHATKPREGRDASELYLALTELKSSLQERFGEVILNIGYFQSGDLGEINKIPEKSTATMDIRPAGELAKKEPIEIIEMLRSYLQKRQLNLSNYQINFNMKPLYVQPSTLAALEQVVYEAGITPKFGDLGGTSEAGEINFKYEFPCVNFGPSPKDYSHKSDEYVNLDSLEKCKKVYGNLIDKYS